MGKPMSRKSRKAQRRRKRTRPLAQRGASAADAMHQALGEFLTEMGRVEFQMLLLMDFLNGEVGIEALFAETTGKPFGEKIKSFKTWSDFGAPEAQKPALQAIYKDLDDLLPKRNFLVHGETREGAFKGKPRQPYRVGLVKNNLRYLDEFDSGEHGPNIFDVGQAKAVSQLCRKILDAIADLRASIPVSDEPYQEEPDDPAAWPPARRVQ
jgi:hypothetical protein